MGGDQGSRPCVSAARNFAVAQPSIQLKLFGLSDEIETFLCQLGPVPENISICHAAQVVATSDEPLQALRHKRFSSMALALKALSSGGADVCVSAGNTGALMALGRHYVKTLDGVKRPAICKNIPTRTGSSLLLDLGANLNCSADNLVQFAAMGAAQMRLEGRALPRVALLNVGTELAKGSDAVREAARRLSKERRGMQFEGYIEGDELYSGRVDVIVCDGFAGNVALKVSEGLVRHLVASIDEYFSASYTGRLARLIAGPILKAWSKKKNPSLYNGAAFLGLKKSVIKSHGGADELGLEKALEAAAVQVELDVPAQLERGLKQCLPRNCQS